MVNPFVVFEVWGTGAPASPRRLSRTGPGLGLEGNGTNKTFGRPRPVALGGRQPSVRVALSVFSLSDSRAGCRYAGRGPVEVAQSRQFVVQAAGVGEQIDQMISLPGQGRDRRCGRRSLECSLVDRGWDGAQPHMTTGAWLATASQPSLAELGEAVLQVPGA